MHMLDVAQVEVVESDRNYVKLTVGREVYLHCPSGYGRSPLANPFWERRFATVATTRNWRTVNALVDMAGG